MLSSIVAKGVTNMSFENPTLVHLFVEEFFNYRIRKPLYESHVKHMKLKGNEKVLDFGCGGGASSRPFLKELTKGGHLTCLDISKFWLSKAKKRFKNFSNVEFKLGDICKIDIPDPSFDVISIFDVLHDIVQDRRQDTVDTLSSKLKPGGKLFIKEPIRTRHGMPVDEIRYLMKRGGLKEVDFKINKSTYVGSYKS